MGDVILNGGRVVALSGGAGDGFVVNVTGRFVLTGGSTIVASGVPPSTVLYNIIGTGSAVALNGRASIDGTIPAVERDIALTPPLSTARSSGGRTSASSAGRACAVRVARHREEGEAAPILRCRGSPR